ncbi:MAG: 4-phosphopantetheinyl transferase family protein [Nitrospirae bacterium]|nr:4-phosphopantetheinyl transferase family protein [Nitrospirota bacterium]
MIKNSEELSVHAMSFAPRLGPIFYASLPCGSAASGPLRRFLVSTLLEHLLEFESPHLKHSHASDRKAFPLQVVRGPLGRPLLLLMGERPGPAISFSEGGGKIWAALSGDDSDIGIDAAAPDEFQGGYPFHRVFNSQELEHALVLTGGNLEKAAALLWSVKEASVKALGSAFHLVDPLQITVYPAEEGMTEGNSGHTFPVGLSGKALFRFPLVSDGSLRVCSLPKGNMWLSIALLNERPTDHE